MRHVTTQQAPRLPRAERREQILSAATTAFARHGFAATNLDDIAAQADVSRVILYRHFDSKVDLYQAVLDRFCTVLSHHVPSTADGFTDATIDGLLSAAKNDPDGFRLLFVHAAREPEFQALAHRFHSSITQKARAQISHHVTNQAWAQWAAQLAPTVAIESIIAWLDAGQPDQDLATNRIRHVVAAVITATTSDSDTAHSLFPTGQRVLSTDDGTRP